MGLAERALVSAMAAKSHSRALSAMRMIDPSRGSALALAAESVLLFATFSQVASWGGRFAEEVGRIYPPSGCSNAREIPARVDVDFFNAAIALAVSSISARDFRECADYFTIAIFQAPKTPWKGRCLAMVGLQVALIVRSERATKGGDSEMTRVITVRLAAILEMNNYPMIAQLLRSALASEEAEAELASALREMMAAPLPPCPLPAGQWNVPL